MTDKNYDDMTKDELVAAADKRGVDSTGTKADIIGRLEDADGTGPKTGQVKTYATETGQPDLKAPETKAAANQSAPGQPAEPVNYGFTPRPDAVVNVGDKEMHTEEESREGGIV